MKIEIQAETVATVERERERERATLYSTWNSSTRPSRLLEKENRGINKIKIDNKITIKPKNEKI